MKTHTEDISMIDGSKESYYDNSNVTYSALNKSNIGSSGNISPSSRDVSEFSAKLNK